MKQNKNQNKQKNRGAEGFDSYYNEVFSERWEILKKALLEETFHASLTFPDCETYFMDPASICAALCLPLENATDVLDLCAAPGGKTLVLSGNLNEDASLQSNERSAERKNRLAKVVAQSLPEDVSKKITVTCSDGGTLCQRTQKKFQSILLDAPCSSERHVLKDSKYLSIWSPARLKTMSMEQWALISSAWRLLEENGFLLYATCALSPKENDEIISRLLKKFDEAELVKQEDLKSIFCKNLSNLKEKNIEIKILDNEKKETQECATSEKEITLEEIFMMSQKTEFGMHILPDSSNGFGPLFFSLIKKGTVENQQPLL